MRVCYLCGDSFEYMSDFLDKQPVTHHCRSCGLPTCANCGESEWDFYDIEQRTCRSCAEQRRLVRGVAGRARSLARWLLRAATPTLTSLGLMGPMRSPPSPQRAVLWMHKPELDDCPFGVAEIGLLSPDPSVRMWAASHVARLEVGPPRDLRADLLLPLCLDPDFRVRSYVAIGLWGLASDATGVPSRVEEGLVTLSRDEVSVVRERALEGLIRLAKGSEQARRRLIEALDDPDPHVARVARGGVRCVGVEVDPLRIFEVEELKDTDRANIKHLLNALRDCGPQASEAAANLVGVFTRASDRGRLRLLKVLSRLSITEAAARTIWLAALLSIESEGETYYHPEANGLLERLWRHWLQDVGEGGTAPADPAAGKLALALGKVGRRLADPVPRRRWGATKTLATLARVYQEVTAPRSSSVRDAVDRTAVRSIVERSSLDARSQELLIEALSNADPAQRSAAIADLGPKPVSSAPR